MWIGSNLYIGLIWLCVVYIVRADDVIEDAILRTTELIKKYGYISETHEVQTDDGYILTHHRIPFGRNGPGNFQRPIVLLQHGFLGSSSDWILTTPAKALGYRLADEGYDVWLLNTRGNEYSTKHAFLSTSSSKYWNFSWHDIGTKDLPSSIKYILGLTGQLRLHHIGHSQGTTSFFVMLAEKPEYQQYIYGHISFAPIAFRQYTQNSFYRAVAAVEKTGGILAINSLFGQFAFAPSSSLLQSLSRKTCKDASFAQVICSNIYFQLMGNNPEQLNKTLLPAIFGHFPAGSSMKQFTHSVQLINSGRFCKFDYKLLGNLQQYNSRLPPEYNIGNIQAPVYTFYGGSDTITDIRDVARLHELLPNLVGTTFIQKWNHMDFLLGIDSPTLVYDIVMRVLTQFSNS